MATMKKRAISALCALCTAATLFTVPAGADTVQSSDDDWNTIITDDCATEDCVTARYKPYGSGVNREYGFVHYTQHSQVTADHWLGFDYGMQGNSELTFDMFIDDIDYDVSNTVANDKGWREGIDLDIFVHENGSHNCPIADSNTEGVQGWSNTMKTDSGEALTIGQYATARRMYGLDETGGKPTHIDVKVVIKDGKMTTYKKWNTESNWNVTMAERTLTKWEPTEHTMIYWISGMAYISVDNVVVKYNLPPTATADKSYIKTDEDTVTLAFSENIGTYPTELALTGGNGGETATVTKIDGKTFSIATTGLAAAKTYEAVLSGFVSGKTSLACKGTLTLNTYNGAESFFEDDFELGTKYWSLTNMSVSDSALTSVGDDLNSGASMTGSSECGWENFEADISMKMIQNNGWTMIKVRDTETFLLRSSGIWHYDGSGETALYFFSQNESKGLATSLSADKFYTYHIEADGDTISIFVLDGDTELGKGSFKTEKTGKGRINFKSYGNKMSIAWVKVTARDSNEILNDGYLTVAEGETKSLTDAKNLKWTSSNEAAVSVDENGVIKGIACGGSVICATCENGDTDSVYVYAAPADYFDFICGSAQWSASNMSVKDGILISESDENFTSASLNIGKKNFTADIEMSLYENGWTQIKARGNQAFLLRNWGIWSYIDGEKYLCALSEELLPDKYYRFHIEAVGNKISLSIYNGDKKLGSGSFTATNLEKGALNITTFGKIVKIKNVKIVSYDDEILSKSAVLLEKASAEKLSASKSVTYTSSNEEVVTVDRNGNVTAVGAGTAIVTATAEDGSTDTCTVTVYEKPTSLVMKQEVTTLKKGEAIGVSVTGITPATADGYLNWHSSDDGIVKITGNTYTRRSLIAVDEGSAKITVENCDGDVLYENVVTVMPKKEKYTQIAYASFGNEKTKIEPLLYGMHTPNTLDLSDEQHKIFGDLNFKFTRSYQMSAQTTGIYDLANENNIPQMLGLDVINRSVDELVEDLKAMHEKQNNNATIYIELGNELYDPGFRFDRNGDGVTDANDYVLLCTPIYNALKAYAAENGFEVKIGAVLLGDELTGVGNTRLDTWDEIIMNNPDFYDAVILHQYSTFNNEDGKTADEAMRYMYASNDSFQAENKQALTEFPGKELWITEYGTLLMDVFTQSFYSEKARLQFANTAGMAVVNAEKLLDMAADGTVKMSSYHCFADLQGFGLVTGAMFLPEYYTFKKIGELINKYEYAYPENAVYANTQKSGGKTYKEIGIWGFGGEGEVEYAVISNRSKNPVEFALDGYKLIPEQSYGGGENILSGFMEEKKTMYALADIPEPKLLSGEAQKSVVLDEYSITFCRVEKDLPVTGAYMSVSNGEFNHLTDSLQYSSESGAKLYKNGEEIQFTESGTDVKTIVPEGGFEYDAEYKIVSGDAERVFRTVTKPPFENYTTEFEDDFSYGVFSRNSLDDYWNFSSTHYKWEHSSNKGDGKVYRYNSGLDKSLSTKAEYENYVITFDLEPVLSTANVNQFQIHLRGGYFRFSYKSKAVQSYFNGKNDAGVGYCPDYESAWNIKIIAYNEFIYIWCAADGGEYKYVGRCENAPLGKTPISFTGMGYWYLDNVAIKTDNAAVMSEVKFSTVSAGEEIETIVPSVGENIVRMNVKSDYADAFCAVAAYNGGKLKNLSEFENGVAKINLDSGDKLKIFAWNSKEDLSPLAEAFTPLADGFAERPGGYN